MSLFLGHKSRFNQTVALPTPGVGALTVDLCNGVSKRALLPTMLSNFSTAYRQSLTETAALSWFLTRGAGQSPSACFDAMRAFTVYRDEPPCIDTAQSLAESLESQLKRGYFGDCAAYCVAISAIQKAARRDAGKWLLCGDARDEARHIINWFPLNRATGPGNRPDASALLIDATVPHGNGWPLPKNLTRAALIDPETGAVIHRWSL